MSHNTEDEQNRRRRDMCRWMSISLIGIALIVLLFVVFSRSGRGKNGRMMRGGGGCGCNAGLTY